MEETHTAVLIILIKSSRVRTPKNKLIVGDIRKKLELPSLGVTSPIKEIRKP